MNCAAEIFEYPSSRQVDLTNRISHIAYRTLNIASLLIGIDTYTFTIIQHTRLALLCTSHTLRTRLSASNYSQAPSITHSKHNIFCFSAPILRRETISCRWRVEVSISVPYVRPSHLQESRFVPSISTCPPSTSRNKTNSDGCSPIPILPRPVSMRCKCVCVWRLHSERFSR